MKLCCCADFIDVFRIASQGKKHLAVQVTVMFHGLKNVQGMSEGHTCPVGAIFQKGSEDVGYSHDTRGQGNLICRQTQGIAFAIQAFVMQGSPDSYILKARNAVEQAEAEFCMTLHLVELIMIKGAFLFQNGTGNPQFAYVVQKACNKDLAILFPVDLAFRPEHVSAMQDTGGMRYACRMRGREWTAKIGDQGKEKTEGYQMIRIKNDVRIA